MVLSMSDMYITHVHGAVQEQEHPGPLSDAAEASPEVTAESSQSIPRLGFDGLAELGHMTCGSTKKATASMLT